MEKVLIFWKKPRTNPYGKLQILGLFQNDFFTTPIQLLFTKNITKHFLLLCFALKQKMEQVLIFLMKPWSNPLKSAKFLGLFYIDVFL